MNKKLSKAVNKAKAKDIHSKKRNQLTRKLSHTDKAKKPSLLEMLEAVDNAHKEG